MSDRHPRRRLLQAGGAALPAALGGCLSGLFGDHDVTVANGHSDPHTLTVVIRGPVNPPESGSSRNETDGGETVTETPSWVGDPATVTGTPETVLDVVVDLGPSKQKRYYDVFPDHDRTVLYEARIRTQRGAAGTGRFTVGGTGFEFVQLGVSDDLSVFVSPSRE